MNDTLISIIVPIYNVEKYLDRCINSLVKQTYKNIEIILVDDGSKDYSGKIADNWGEKDSRIKIYHKENGGLSDARNYGIEKSSGKYLSFVDSDDYVDERFIEVLYQILIKNKVKISAVGIQKFSNKEYNIEKNYFNEKDEIFDTEKAIQYLYNNSKYCNYAWNKLYLKELFNDIKYPYGRKMEDLGTTYLLFDKCEYVAYNSIPLYFYYQRENSILHNPDKQFWIDKFVLVSERYKYIKRKYPDIYENYLNYFYVVLESFFYISKKERKNSIEEIKKIYPNIRKKISLKSKLKYSLIIYFSRLDVRL